MNSSDILREHESGTNPTIKFDNLATPEQFRLVMTLRNFMAISALWTGLAPATVLITPTGVTNTSGVSEFFPLANIANDSGLSGTATFANYNTVTHGSASSSTAWTTVNPNGNGDYFLEGSPGTPAVITLALGAVYEVTDFVFWGYHFGSANGNEAREFSLEFSTDGGGSFGAPVTVSNPLSTYAVQNANTLPLGGTFAADTVRLTIDDNHSGGAAPGGDRLGLGEVKFVVPEPSNFLLSGLAALTLLRRRR